jgi:hypothetical protein
MVVWIRIPPLGISILPILECTCIGPYHLMATLHMGPHHSFWVGGKWYVLATVIIGTFPKNLKKEYNDFEVPR